MELLDSNHNNIVFYLQRTQLPFACGFDHRCDRSYILRKRKPFRTNIYDIVRDPLCDYIIFVQILR